MAIVWNPTQDHVEVKIVGKYFTFGPGKKKVMQDNIAHFISTDRKESGLTVLPPEFEEDADYEKTTAGQEIMERLKEDSITHLVNHHRRIIANNQVSLKQDLDKANLKIDPSALVSKGEIESMRIVAKYQRAKQDTEQVKMDEVKKLMQEINKK